MMKKADCIVELAKRGINNRHRAGKTRGGQHRYFATCVAISITGFGNSYPEARENLLLKIDQSNGERQRHTSGERKVCMRGDDR